MLHQSLCSATGMPHSTQIRTRGRGVLFFEKSLLINDMAASGWIWRPIGAAPVW